MGKGTFVLILHLNFPKIPHTAWKTVDTIQIICILDG